MGRSDRSSADCSAGRGASSGSGAWQSWDVQRSIFLLLVILTVLAVFAALYFARALLFPITLAFIVSLVFSPLVRKLKRLHIPRSVSAALILLGLIVIVTIGLISLLGPAERWLQKAPAHLREAQWKLRSLRMPLAGIEEAQKSVEEITQGDQEEDPVPVEVQAPNATRMLLNATREVLAGVFITVVLSYFLLAIGDRLALKVVESMPNWHAKRRAVQVILGMQRNLSRYLCTITAINIGLGVVIGTGMWLLGLPNPLLWGVMAACLNFIPYLGATVGASVVFLVGLLTFDTAGQALLAPLIYVAANTLEAYFVTPTLLGHSVKLNPVAIILFLATFGWLWGVGGALLAVPLLATMKSFCEHFETLLPVAKFLAR